MNKIELNNQIMYHFAYPALEEILNNQVVVIKGVPLSILAYSNTFSRKSNDIDLLVSKHDIKYIESILKQNGFEQRIKENHRKERVFCMSNSHQIFPYIKKVNSYEITIDINFDIFWGEYEGKRIDLEEFLSDFIYVEIYGKKIKTLPPLKAMVQLILHNYKDLNSIFLIATRKTIDVCGFKDIYYLLKNNKEELSINNLYAICEKYEILPYAFYMLYYTNLIFEDDDLKKYVDAFKNNAGLKLLNQYGLNENERKEWNTDFKTRLFSDDLLHFIQKDLSTKDFEKIKLNKRYFGS